jgi:hypothetical protein
MMYWTIKNDELASGGNPPDASHAVQAGGPDEGGTASGWIDGGPVSSFIDSLLQEDIMNELTFLPQTGLFHGPQVLVVPSLHPGGPTASLLDYIAGLRYYEERQLYHLFLLRKQDPVFRVIFVSSVDIPREVIAYYFRLMRTSGSSYTDEDEADWWERLVLLPIRDSSPAPITKKILRNPPFLSLMRAHTSPNTGMFCVFSTGREEKIASSLGVPLLGVRKNCLHWGTKSGSREAFLHTGVPHPQGTKLCFSKRELAHEMAAMWRYLESKYQRLTSNHPTNGDQDAWRALMPRTVVLKLDDAFSGEGNALLDLSGVPLLAYDPERLSLRRSDSKDEEEEEDRLAALMERQLTAENTRFQAVEECWETFAPKIASVGVLAELFLDSDERDIRNPSGQACIDSDRQVYLMATHEQMMGGPDGQNYQGCVFPANATYRQLIQASVRKVGQYLASRGALGHFSVDFLARRVDPARPGTSARLVAERHTQQPPVQSNGGRNDVQGSALPEPNCAFDENGNLWDLHALEINLRPGGATHPIMTLNLLTDGRYDETTGLYKLNEDCPLYAHLPDDEQYRYYVASDNVKNPAFVGMTTDEIIALFQGHPLEFHGRRATGTIFHMMSCAREFGKLGMVCIGRSPAEAEAIYDATFQRLLASRQQSFSGSVM